MLVFRGVYNPLFTLQPNQPNPGALNLLIWPGRQHKRSYHYYWIARSSIGWFQWLLLGPVFSGNFPIGQNPDWPPRHPKTKDIQSTFKDKGLLGCPAGTGCNWILSPRYKLVGYVPQVGEINQLTNYLLTSMDTLVKKRAGKQSEKWWCIA